MMIVFLALISNTYSLAQSDTTSRFPELSWNEFYKLTWDDFNGLPDKDSRGDAGTAVAIRAKPFIVRKEVHFDVVATFNRNKSWVRDRSPSLLAHEQIHFDIAEWYARKIRKRIAELKSRGVNDIAVFNETIRALMQESNQVDRQYDLETLHGALSKKQAAWAKNVENSLAELDRYQKEKRVIRK